MNRGGGLLLGLLLSGLALVASGCARAPQQKVFVLGIDGLTFDLLLPWARQGHLPNFARLLEEGSSTQLISTIPPISPVAWTTAVTGVNPGKHGVFGFVKEFGRAEDGGFDLKYYTALDRQVDPIWILLSERDRRCLVVNVPCSSPPDKVKGIMISGFPYTSETHFTYPPEYRLQIPHYRKDHYRKAHEEGEAAFLEDLNAIMDRRADVLSKLLQEQSWDLFFIVFTLTDRVQHYFWKFMDPQHPQWNAEGAARFSDAILQAYRRMDNLLGQLRPQLDEETTLVIMSDHGFGPVCQPINAQNFIDQRISSGPLSVISGDTYGATFYVAAQQGASIAQETQQAYQRTSDRLTEQLADLRDPVTDQKVIETIYRKEDLYQGPAMALAPDVVGLEKRGYLFWNWHPTDDGLVFPPKSDAIFERMFSGYHVMNGVLILSGAHVRKGVTNFTANLADIAPTILYLLKEPIPEDMDGRVLSEPIAASFLKDHPLETRWARPDQFRPAEGLTDSSKAVNEYIEEQLRAIGYVQ